MEFLHPELLLLSIPLLFAWWQTRTRDRGTNVVRLIVVLLLVTSLAIPYLTTSQPGRDLIVLMDRSRSMPEEGEARAVELITLARDELGRGDRLGVISFGAETKIEQAPSAQSNFHRFETSPGTNGTDLGGALEGAIHLIPRSRSGRILVISDGENNGRDPIPLARQAFARGIEIDVRTLVREGSRDISIDRLDLPDQVSTGEPFQFTAWVHSDVDTETDVTLSREGEVLSAGKRHLKKGMNRLVFRDVATNHGVATYSLAVGAEGDRVPENNRALAATSVIGRPVVLVINDDGEEDTLARALRRGQVEVVTMAPESESFDAVSLTRYRAVILENVAATRLGAGKSALRDFVTERGGGLLITGGRASFGVGGYYKSALDELLPVSMELRKEQRKLGVAIAMVLDRSGSMGAPVAGNLRKMDLANQGVAAAVKLLSPIDAVSVIAVDSTDHLIVGLQPVVDPNDLARKALRIESMGGGIYVRTGLVAAARELRGADHANRHIVLFADAADSEEQEGCYKLVDDLFAAGVTLSVIALGTKGDSDATFLEEIARRGGGSAYFTTSPTELPRLFAHDTLLKARASFITDPTATVTLPGLFGLGGSNPADSPQLDGYNLNWLRPGATAAIATTDEYKAPILAYHHKGLGRVAALSAQIGGEFGASFTAWGDLSSVMVTLARWLIGTEEPETFFPSVRREGMDAIISVEVDPSEGLLADTSRLEARIQPNGGDVKIVPLQRVSEDRFEARTRIPEQGITLGSVRLSDDRFVTLPPLVLPHSPEFERSPDPQRGARLLRRVAENGGGGELTSVSDLFAGETKSRGRRRIGSELAIVALLLLLVEIASRRLALFAFLARPRAASTTPAAAREAGGSNSRVAPSRVDPTPRGDDEEAETAPRNSTPPASPDAPGLGSALDRAKRSSNRRLGK